MIGNLATHLTVQCFEASSGYFLRKKNTSNWTPSSSTTYALSPCIRKAAPFRAAHFWQRSTRLERKNASQKHPASASPPWKEHMHLQHPLLLKLFSADGGAFIAASPWPPCTQKAATNCTSIQLPLQELDGHGMSSLIVSTRCANNYRMMTFPRC